VVGENRGRILIRWVSRDRCRGFGCPCQARTYGARDSGGPIGYHSSGCGRRATLPGHDLKLLPNYFSRWVLRARGLGQRAEDDVTRLFPVLGNAINSESGAPLSRGCSWKGPGSLQPTHAGPLRASVRPAARGRDLAAISQFCGTPSAPRIRQKKR
jgi:hypothetical protein